MKRLQQLISRQGGWALAGILVTGLLLTAWATWATHQSSQARVQAQFEGHVDRLQQEVINRIERAEYGLRGIRGALLSNPEMSKADFDALVGSRDAWREFRGVRGFGFIQRVERKDLPEFIARRRRDGQPDFTVRSTGNADDLYIVRYMAPVKGNEAAIGYDLGSDPVRRETLMKAAQTGEATLTPRVVLLQDQQAGAGLVYLLPLYASSTTPGKGQTESGKVLGFVHTPLVGAEILGDLKSFVEFMLDIRLYEGTPSDGRVMFDTLRKIDPKSLAPLDNAFATRPLHIERQFLIGDRVFTLETAGLPTLERSIVGWNHSAVIVAASGIAVTLLLVFAALLMLRSQLQAQALAKEMTADLATTSRALELSNGRLRAAMEDLTANSALLRLITDNMPGRIVYWDREGICRFANREFIQNLGSSSESVIGQPAHDVFGDRLDPQRADRVMQVLAGQHLVFEECEPDSNGTQRSRLIHYIPDEQDGQVRGFFSLGLDVTELQQARDDALRASRAKSQFVANMSHELRTPMNAVLGMLQLVQNTALTHQQKGYLGKAEGAAKALLSVLNDILDFSKVEAGKMTLDPRAFEIDALLRDLSLIYATSLAGKPVEFVYDLHPDLPAKVIADDMRLRQVLINLGGNAVKFTQHGQVVLAVRPVAWTPGAVTAEFSITDTGIGIAPENLRFLFQDFGQAEASTTRKFGGTGLGLAISRKLVSLMGGDLKVESRQGEGSRFSFELVLPLADGQSAPSVAMPPLVRKRALIVDAQPITRGAHERMLQALGWEARSVATGREAEALVAGIDTPFDAILVDWMVDDEVPLAVARRVSSHLPKDGPPLILLGTVEVNELLAQLEPERQGMISCCLMRPVTPAMLQHALSSSREALVSRVAPAAPTLALRKLRLLVAEDNENNQLIARELLSAQGADVLIAHDGLEAVAHMREDGRFDAILMDWQMPRMDGLQACREIRALGHLHVPIIAMTANAMESDRKQCLAAGMDDHVAKPFDLRELVDVILRHTGRLGAVPLPAPPSAPEPKATVDQPTLTTPAPLLARDAAIEQLGGSVELYDQLVPMFREDLKGTLELIQSVVSGSVERESARRPTHTLKGTAGTLGALRLAAAAHRMEQSLASGQGMQEAMDSLHADATATLLALEAV